ncbi:thermonuclease family protein [Shinella pollutisoli]|uniref:Thermonuclease family protein n=1 Tax=Shinella pollutisoli TaxID=2250594 RepID=A0ABV7DLV1_9HYPH|nr:hypothetical protein [Shinella pollutisoli]
MAKAKGRRKKRVAAKRPPAARRGGMTPWYVTGVAVVAAAVYFGDAGGRPETPAAAIRTASIERGEKVRTRQAVLPRPKQRPAETVEEKLPPFAGKWFICTTQTDYCVLDGNTILYAGRKVRLADIDAPAIAEARCDAERLKGGDAKLRLREILNEGGVTLAAVKGAGARTGAAPHLVLGNGRSVGARLVGEGLARPWTGRHQSWCG